LVISNIRVDEGWDSKQFILYGARVRNITEAVVIHLNFDDAYPGGKCREGLDFEDWAPANDHGNCFMGEKTTYSRRKFGVKCYYGTDHQIKKSSTACACTKDDYECTSCFFQPALGHACVRECGVQHPAQRCKPKETFYEVEEGMTKIEGDKCDVNNPLSVRPKGQVPCDYVSIDEPHKDKTNVFFQVVLVALMVVGFAVFAVYLWRNNDTFRSFLSGTVGIGGSNLPRGGTLADSSDEEALTPGSEVINSDPLSDSDEK